MDFDFISTIIGVIGGGAAATIYWNLKYNKLVVDLRLERRARVVAESLNEGLAQSLDDATVSTAATKSGVTRVARK